MKLFLIAPHAVHLKILDETYSRNIIEKWRFGGKILPISSFVKGVIKDSRELAINRLIDNVKEYLDTFPDIKEGSLKYSDFTLSFSVAETDEKDSVWTGARMYEYVELT